MEVVLMIRTLSNQELFGFNLNNILAEKKIKKIDFCFNVRLEPSELSRIISGKKKYLKIDFIFDVCKELNIEAGQLFEKKGG